MKLNVLEKKLLSWIDRQYPLAWSESQKDSVMVLGTKAIPTRDDIAKSFAKHSAEQIDDSLKTLLSYECIHYIYLYGPGEYEGITVAGSTILCPLGKRGTGADAYQITEFGKRTIQPSITEQAKKSIITTIIDLIKDHFKAYIVALATALLVWLAGRLACSTITEKPPAIQNNEQLKAAAPKLQDKPQD